MTTFEDLPKEVQDEIEALLREEKVSPLEKPAIPFCCPICQWTGWKVKEVEVSELDTSNSLVRPYSSEVKASTWTFGCGHKVKNTIGVGAEVVEEEEEEEEI